MALEKLSRLLIMPFERAYNLVVRWSAPVPTFCETEGVPWIEELESNWAIIRSELDRLRREHDIPGLNDVIRGNRRLADARWKLFPLIGYGRPIKMGAEQCPQTVRLLQNVPGLVSGCFSMLGPGVHLTPHQGVFSGVLRFHMGLDIPDVELCGIRVSDETRHWREGKSLFFDDTNEHEAWNHTDRDRVVLFLDIKRAIPWPVRVMNDLVLFLLGWIFTLALLKSGGMQPRRQPAKAMGPPGTV